MLISTLSISKTALELQERIINDKKTGSQWLVKTFSNLKSDLIQKTDQKRTIDFPTQVIRLDGTVKKPDIDCQQLSKEFSSLLIDKIYEQPMYISLSMGCYNNPIGEKKIYFRLAIDPMTDDAVGSLEDLIAQYNGTDFYGLPILFESAKALIVSLNIKAFHEKDSDNNEPSYPFTIQKSIYFNNWYDALHSLEQDINERLFSMEEDSISSFLDKWSVKKWDSFLFLKALRRSNQIDIVNEYSFLMDKEPKLVSIEYFNHLDCGSFPSQHCMQ